jgi:hypothetical protein
VPANLFAKAFVSGARDLRSLSMLAWGVVVARRLEIPKATRLVLLANAAVLAVPPFCPGH